MTVELTEDERQIVVLILKWRVAVCEDQGLAANASGSWGWKRNGMKLCRC